MASDVIETDRFVLFWTGWPSQWHKSQFRVAGVDYNCCEQYMMAEKARVFQDVESLGRILATTSPREQKALGRRVKSFDARVWNSVCRGIVYVGNLARFMQNDDLANLLTSTGDKIIVEASPKDSIWGIGLSANDPRAQDPPQWPGTNWLGIALMQVRDSIRQNPHGRAMELDPILKSQLEMRSALSTQQPARTTDLSGASLDTKGIRS